MNQPSAKQSLLVGIGLLLITFGAPALGVFSPPSDWYQSINKPTWNPPPWIFGPVWTALYLMMATAAWLVWKHGKGQDRGEQDQSKKALTAYFVQLALNTLWTPLFFGIRRIDWAFVDILALWFAILVCILTFYRVHRVAAWLMLPYLAWVTFASVLNATLWVMNR